MSQWTDKHYNFTYKLTQKDVEAGEIKVDPYFVGMVWKTGSRDDSGALAHCLKTIARFGDKNPVEREIKALYAQVKGLARVHGVMLEDEQPSNTSHSTGMMVQGSGIKLSETSQIILGMKDTTLSFEEAPWYPDDSGAWIECDGSGQPVGDDVEVMVLLRHERITKEYEPLQDYAGSWCWTWGVGGNDNDIVAYKIVEF